MNILSKQMKKKSLILRFYYDIFGAVTSGFHIHAISGDAHHVNRHANRLKKNRQMSPCSLADVSVLTLSREKKKKYLKSIPHYSLLVLYLQIYLFKLKNENR